MTNYIENNLDGLSKIRSYDLKIAGMEANDVYFINIGNFISSTPSNSRLKSAKYNNYL